ncbi:PstS family phosphate ABC transporter substrate-binding protein [Thalassoglobus sp. JC818]|uniref:PstS family phosphate ABC transporter substrate-binding protein n=1 Tax=Thalassoglobus sp. JC818 TaxID=3232136 RepID=UPI0034595F42
MDFLTQEGIGMKLLGVRRFLEVAAMVLCVVSISGAETVDPTLPVYTRSEDVKGTLTLIGSNTMSQIGATWGAHFQRLYPDVTIDIKVQGATNAVTSVIDGEANFGLLSRSINEEEVKAFYEKFGYVPTILTPALEPLAIYVHKDNPIESLSLAQLDAIYSTSLKRGESKVAMTWGDVGVTGQWASQPIELHGRLELTGSQVFFQSAIMGGGEFRKEMIPHETNLALVSALEKSPTGIGFAGSTFGTPELKIVPLSWKSGEEAVGIDQSNYPLVRRLQLVVNSHPERPLSPLEREFIKYVFSQRGQQDVVISGFLPVPAGAANIALQAVGEKTLN